MILCICSCQMSMVKCLHILLVINTSNVLCRDICKKWCNSNADSQKFQRPFRQLEMTNLFKVNSLKPFVPSTLSTTTPRALKTKFLKCHTTISSLKLISILDRIYKIDTYLWCSYFLFHRGIETGSGLVFWSLQLFPQFSEMKF